MSACGSDGDLIRHERLRRRGNDCAVSERSFLWNHEAQVEDNYVYLYVFQCAVYRRQNNDSILPHGADFGAGSSYRSHRHQLQLGTMESLEALEDYDQNRQLRHVY